MHCVCVSFSANGFALWHFPILGSEVSGVHRQWNFKMKMKWINVYTDSDSEKEWHSPELLRLSGDIVENEHILQHKS